MRNNGMYTTEPDETLVDFSIDETTRLEYESEISEYVDFDFRFDENQEKQFEELIKHDPGSENI